MGLDGVKTFLKCKVSCLLSVLTLILRTNLHRLSALADGIEHNFGHGTKTLSNLRATMILTVALLHTASSLGLNVELLM